LFVLVIRVRRRRVVAYRELLDLPRVVLADDRVGVRCLDRRLDRRLELRRLLRVGDRLACKAVRRSRRISVRQRNGPPLAAMVRSCDSSPSLLHIALNGRI
jgi:hypothetical protein